MTARSLLRRALPRTLLARNIALLIVLVMLSQVCSLGVLLHYVQRPRVERAAAVFAVYVSTLDERRERAEAGRSGRQQAARPL